MQASQATSEWTSRVIFRTNSSDDVWQPRPARRKGNEWCLLVLHPPHPPTRFVAKIYNKNCIAKTLLQEFYKSGFTSSEGYFFLGFILKLGVWHTTRPKERRSSTAIANGINGRPQMENWIRWFLFIPTAESGRK